MRLQATLGRQFRFIVMKNILIILLIIIGACSPKTFKSKWTEEQAPESFSARFETTKGNFDIYSERKWSPEAVDRLYQLIKNGFYEDIALFRVVPDFVVQFGIHTDSATNAAWKGYPVSDEPVVKKNEKGTIAFARGGQQTRTTQIFVNLKNNSPYLDELAYSGVKGFPVVAEVTNGMDVIESFYDKYGGAPANRQDSIYAKGNEFLKRKYPELDYITKGYLLKD